MVRYVLRVKSALGAETLTYEGLHCAGNNHKRYAIGRPAPLHTLSDWTDEIIEPVRKIDVA